MATTLRKIIFVWRLYALFNHSCIIIYGLFVSPPCLTLPKRSSSPPLLTSSAASLSSGPPTPSKSFAFVCLMCAVLAKLLNFLAFSAVFPLSSCSGDDCKGGERGRGWEETYFFVCGLMPPPSSSGISRLSPAPDAAEPYVTVAPGNLFSTSSLTPDSSTITIQDRVISQLNQDCLWCLLRDERDVGEKRWESLEGTECGSRGKSMPETIRKDIVLEAGGAGRR